MRKTIIVLGTCLLLTATGRAADQVPLARDLRIAVVDISRVFNEYKRSVVMRKSLIDLMRSYSNRIKSQQRRMARGRAELKEYAAGTAEFLRKEEELRERLKEYRTLQKEATAARNAEWVKMIKVLYDEIRSAVGAYAREKGIDLVIKQQSITDYSDRPGDVTREGMILEISRVTLLFHNASLDITDAIVKRLNDAYAKRGPAAPTGKKLLKGTRSGGGAER